MFLTSSLKTPHSKLEADVVVVVVVVCDVVVVVWCGVWCGGGGGGGGVMVVVWCGVVCVIVYVNMFSFMSYLFVAQMWAKLVLLQILDSIN